MPIENLFRVMLIFQVVFSTPVIIKGLSNEIYPVNVLAFVHPPFTYFDPRHGFVDGIDIRLLNTIAERLNLKLTWTKANNQTTTEQLEQFDVVIGGVRPDYFLNLTNFVAGAPYMQDEVTWCVSHAKAIPRWKNIYYIPQDAITYIWGATMFIITIFGPFLFSTFEKPLDIWHSAIIACQTVIGFPSPFKPKRGILRFHFAMFLVIPFWLTQIFGGFLIAYSQRILYEHQISTVDEIARNSFPLAGDPYTFDQLNSKRAFSKEQLHNFEFCNDIDECLHRLEFDDKLAVATSRLHIQAMPLQQKIFCFDPSQNIHSYLNTFMIKNHFPMKRQFDDMLKRIVTSGLLSKWQKHRRVYRVSVELNSEGKGLSLTDFAYAFQTLIPILGLSISTFFVELIIYKKANSTNSTKYWKFWDKFICGKRYYFLLEPRNDNVVIPFTK